jgi:predicted acylesterase/phospholipase RssA
MQGRPNAIVDKKSGKIIVQTPMPPFHCLALKGGGVACAAHAGLFNILEKYGISDDFEHVSGISGGAIAALGFCMGMSAKRMTEILSNIPMDKFMEGSESWAYTPTFFSNVRKLFSIWNSPHHALSSGKVFLEWLKALVKEGMGDELATFEDLDRKIKEEKRNHGVTKKKNLYIGSTVVTIGIPELRIMCADKTPKMPLAFAVAASAAYPTLFAPFEYDGHLYGDGGVKNVILTKLFDERSFLPPGIPFSDKAKNPGVLAVNVYTQKEIDQIVSGRCEQVKIEKTRDYAGQLIKAASYNEDIDEIRHARNTITISDAGVDRTNLYLPPSVIMDLVHRGESAAKEFFENHIFAAYDIKAYNDMADWLGTLSIEGVFAVEDIYEEMLEKLQQNTDEMRERELLAEFDPARPTVKQLEDQIRFMGQYKNFRLAKCKNANENIINPVYPVHHINIPPEFPKSAWHEKIKYELQQRLDQVQQKIDSAEAEYEKFMSELAAYLRSDSPALGHDDSAEFFRGYNDEKVQVLVSYNEHLNKLYQERNTIECKLGIKCDYHVIADAENSKQFVDLRNKLDALKEINFSPSMRLIMPEEMPIFTFKVTHNYDITYSIDLRKKIDRSLYLIAVMLFFQNKKRFAERDKFNEVCMSFRQDNQSVPTTADQLVKMIGQKDPELQVSLFRLESLVHYFEIKEKPLEKPAFSLYEMFGLSSNPIPGNRNDQDVEMHLLIKDSINCDIVHDEMPVTLQVNSSQKDDESSTEEIFRLAAR